MSTTQPMRNPPHRRQPVGGVVPTRKRGSENVPSIAQTTYQPNPYGYRRGDRVIVTTWHDTGRTGAVLEHRRGSRYVSVRLDHTTAPRRYMLHELGWLPHTAPALAAGLVTVGGDDQ